MVDSDPRYLPVVRRRRCRQGGRGMGPGLVLGVSGSFGFAQVDLSFGGERGGQARGLFGE